ncbi:MAG: hypothetical protein DDT29_02557 [Dehalococcoidia bacterium]|nr:hypothetical protein [Bacillota bacterium]
MRTRRDILRDYASTQQLILEVLIDIRDLLVKATKKTKVKKEGKGNADS